MQLSGVCQSSAHQTYNYNYKKIQAVASIRTDRPTKIYSSNMVFYECMMTAKNTARELTLIGLKIVLHLTSTFIFRFECGLVAIKFLWCFTLNCVC